MSNDATALITPASASYVLDGRLAAGEEACPACTQSIPAGEMYCPRCGYQRGTWIAAKASSDSGAGSAASGPPSPWLLRGSDGREWRLAAGEQAAGRGEVEIRLDDNFASRRHARLVAGDAGLTVEDLGSSNGTFLGAERLNPGEVRSLADGAALRIGQTDLAVVFSPLAAGEEPAAATTPSEARDAAGSQESPAVAEAEPPAAAASPWKLVSERGLEIALPLGELTLGRKADRCDYVVDGDTYISGLHCRLLATETALTITDLGSTNGTFVDDDQLTPDSPRELNGGCQVRLGQTALCVVHGAGADA